MSGRVRLPRFRGEPFKLSKWQQSTVNMLSKSDRELKAHPVGEVSGARYRTVRCEHGFDVDARICPVCCEEDS